MITEQYSAIPNLSLDSPVFVQPLEAEELNREISFRTIKNVPQLRIEFPLPEQKDHWESKVSRLLASFGYLC